MTPQTYGCNKQTWGLYHRRWDLTDSCQWLFRWEVTTGSFGRSINFVIGCYRCFIASWMFFLYRKKTRYSFGLPCLGFECLRYPARCSIIFRPARSISKVEAQNLLWGSNLLGSDCVVKSWVKISRQKCWWLKGLEKAPMPNSEIMFLQLLLVWSWWSWLMISQRSKALKIMTF